MPAIKKKHAFLWRYIALAVFLALVGLVYLARLVNLQITSYDLYTAVNSKTYTRTVKIQAHRGELYDRNGVPLVTNVLQYNLIFDYSALPYGYAAENEVILETLAALSRTGNEDKRVKPVFPYTGTYPHFALDTDLMRSATVSSRHARILADNECDKDSTTAEQIAFFAKKYKMLDADGSPLYDNETMTELLAIRYHMEYIRFSAVEPYVLAEDVSLSLITYIKERQIEGADFLETVTRQFEFPGYASHILGLVRAIPQGQLEYYTAQGYPMNAVVGISGAEQAFEQYLRGQDGELTIVEDEDGKIVDMYVSKEPVAGSNVRLTIDIYMQIAAEDALVENIAYIREKAAATEGTQDGEDASSGALTAMNVHTGEIYALASNPTYDLSTYSTDFSTLNQDPNRPMVNRALGGLYPPGSTFKIGVAAAALTEGIITPDTKIETKGIYEYYAPSYTPRCWYYLRYRMSHGAINVAKALQVSCNYFFYEVGRLLTIDTMNEYMSRYGLGEHTGIELTEETGILAGPEFRETHGRDAWTPGDTLQAAIGQSDNLLTPLQLSVYLSTIANGGTRYAAHLLHSVRSYYDDTVIYAPEPAAVSTTALSARDYQTIMNALKSVTEDDGSAARIFRDYPIEVGGKTGTAQVSEKKSDNAVFTAFAPWSAPEIAVSCIIEQGANGTDAGVAVREIFDFYFGLGAYAPTDPETPAA